MSTTKVSIIIWVAVSAVIENLFLEWKLSRLIIVESCITIIILGHAYLVGRWPKD